MAGQRWEREKLLIGGEWRAASGGTYDVVNPSTEEVVGVAPEASREDAFAAAAAAKQAFKTWSRTTQAERSELLKRTAELLAKHNDELVPLVQAETGATQKVAFTMQVPIAIGRFNRYAQGAMEPNQIPLPPQQAVSTALAPGGLIGGVVNRAPVGVVACIASYNFPMTNMAGKIAPALAMGNTLVVKPAPQDPLNIIDLVAILDEAGFPPGVVNIITGSGAEAGAALVDSPDVDMVSFTGSTNVGIKIAEAGAKTMKRNLMELGGKGAALVFDDANIANAISGIASTWAFHSGQICTAPTRVIAHRSIYQELVDKLTATAKALKTGNPLDEDTIVGPLISAAQRDRVEAYIKGGVEQGATMVAGGERPDIATGYYVAPTLLVDCTIDMTVVQEELFGPVVVVVPFDDEDEAVELANGTSFGLYDYVYTGDANRGFEVAKRLRSGNVGLNTTQRNHEAPFGGFKLSGIGRDGGSFGLHCYSEMQSVVWPS
ncbi:MAG TPA: aldehyde dehydrogenase family protein [Acidimicrobiales bacterium]|nr:aldehyde dehydrogenase family protein [Acidimicrobiales bacterium]